jgi:predicted lipoprotein with Yx(FWY)xxD motif
MAKVKSAILRPASVTVTALATALVVAACGSSSNSGTSASPVPANPAPANPAPASGSGSSSSLTIGTASGSDGTYLTGPSGRALYLWVADTGGKSVCNGSCAKVWPPLVTKGMPNAGNGVKQSDIGTVKRSDGSEQVTYKGHPLYYYISDKSAGQVTGQGSNSFGAKWWLVAPSGASITKSGSAGGSSSSSSASSSSSSGGSSSGGGDSWS